MWLGYRGLFRRWVLGTFMSDAEYDLIEAHRAAIYGMVPARSWSVPGVPDELLDRCVDELTLTGTPADVPGFVHRLRAMAEAGCTAVVLELHEAAASAVTLIGRELVPALQSAGGTMITVLPVPGSPGAPVAPGAPV
jgi:hypothetical protein